MIKIISWIPATQQKNPSANFPIPHTRGNFPHPLKLFGKLCWLGGEDTMYSYIKSNHMFRISALATQQYFNVQ